LVECPVFHGPEYRTILNFNVYLSQVDGKLQKLQCLWKVKKKKEARPFDALPPYMSVSTELPWNSGTSMWNSWKHWKAYGGMETAR
jgi:hypothetical protein